MPSARVRTASGTMLSTSCATTPADRFLGVSSDSLSTLFQSHDTGRTWRIRSASAMGIMSSLRVRSKVSLIELTSPPIRIVPATLSNNRTFPLYVESVVPAEITTRSTPPDCSYVLKNARFIVMSLFIVNLPIHAVVCPETPMLQFPLKFTTIKSRLEFVVSWNRICPESRKIRKSELWLVSTSANSGADEDTVSLPVIDAFCPVRRPRLQPGPARLRPGLDASVGENVLV